jgi:6-pyruvoyltetrahydropterin/6-carboxytetrahydropterin synthase
MIISKKVEFSASHICRSPQLSDAENERVYGAAANPLGHGHNYVVEVAIEGEPDPVTGMILDLKRLKDILEERCSVYDHRLLNREVAPFDRIVPTVENIAIDIWNRLEAAYRRPGARGCIRCACMRRTSCSWSIGAKSDGALSAEATVFGVAPAALPAP